MTARKAGRPGPTQQERRSDLPTSLGFKSNGCRGQAKGNSHAFQAGSPASGAPAHSCLRAGRQGRCCVHVPGGLQLTHSEGGGLVLAHTTDLRRPFLCQPCPALQLLSASEIPRERRIRVGLSPLNLSRKPERLMEPARSAPRILRLSNAKHRQPRRPAGSSEVASVPAGRTGAPRGPPDANRPAFRASASSLRPRPGPQSSDSQMRDPTKL